MKNSSTPVKVGVDWGTNRYVILPTYLTEAVGKLTFSAKISDLTDNTSGKISIGMCTPNNANIGYGTRDVQIVDSTLTVTFDIPSDMSDRTCIYIYGNSGTWDGSATGHLTINDYKLERGNKATDWTPAPEDMATEVQFSQLQLTVNGIQGTAQNKADKSQITQLANQISLKADTTALNTLKGTVDKQGSEITLNTNSIKLKADQSSVNTLKGTVDKQGSAIDVNTKAIALKTSQSTVDTLTGRVSTAEGKITVQADQIAQTVSKTELTTKLNDYATQTWTQGQIKTTADQINLSVSKVQSNLDNMHIGSRNYLKSSDTVVQLHGVTQTYPNGVRADQRYVMFQPIQRYTEDVWVFSTNYIPIAPTPAQPKLAVGVMNHEDTNLFTILGDFPIIDGRLVAAIDLSKVDKQFDSIIVYSSYSGWENSKDKNAQFDHYQMERATTVSDWHPAPEDMATEVQFSQLQVTVNGIQGTVQNKADQSQVTQLANQITSTVTDLSAYNLITNTEFEDQTLNGWGFANPSLWSVGWNNSDVYMGSNALRFHRASTQTPIGWTDAGSDWIEVYAGQVVSASAVMYQTGPEGDGWTPTGLFIIEIDFYKDKTSDRMEFYESNVFDIKSPYVKQQLKVENIKVPEGANYARLHVQTNGTGNILIAHPMLVKRATADTYVSGAVSQSQITQLSNDINLRVQKGDVINQINISPESILIAGQKVHITGQTHIDNAVIKDAMIANVKADKITAGTINGANVNVINLNANNITTGTLKGANLSMNLNTGEVVFQKGAIRSTNGNLNIDISKGTMAVINQYKSGFYFEDGKLVLNDGWLEGTSNQPKYGSLEYNANFFTVNGLAVKGTEGVTIGTPGYNPLAMFTSVNESGIAIDKKHLEIGSVGPTIISSGNRFFMNLLTQSPFIAVGTTADGSYMTTSDPGSRISLYAEYVHIKSAYSKTASGSANVIVAQDGALVRSTSASKYKTDIIRANATDYGDKLLNLPTATWTDIAETKRYRDDPVNQVKPTRNFGMIAEDLADAGLEMLVVRGADGELEGINYDRIGPALIPVIAKLKNEVEILKRKLEEKTA